MIIQKYGPSTMLFPNLWTMASNGPRKQNQSILPEHPIIILVSDSVILESRLETRLQKRLETRLQKLLQTHLETLLETCLEIDASREASL